MKLIIKYFFLILIFVFCTGEDAVSQIAGTKTIPGDYANFSSAINALNVQGVGAGGVVFNVSAGFIDTAVNLTLTSSGTFSDQIIFKKSGTGANPLIIAGTGTSASMDGIFKLVGSDFITIDGIDLRENPANLISVNAPMEWGYALLKSDSTNGCRYNVIKNCNITLSRINSAITGIYAANHTALSSTSLRIGDTLGTNSNNKFQNNSISNVFTGISITGFNAPSSALQFYDQNNEVGATKGERNTITDFGGNASGTSYGVFGIHQNNIKIYNTYINNKGNSWHKNIIHGISLSTGNNSSCEIYGDTISLGDSAATSAVFPINCSYGASGIDNTINIYDNVIKDCSYPTTTTGSMTYINIPTAAFNLNVYNNKIINNTFGSNTSTATGTLNYISVSGGSPTLTSTSWKIYDNLISGNIKNQSAPGAGNVNVINIGATVPTVAVYNNTIEDNSWRGSSGSTAVMINRTSRTGLVCFDNKIRNLSFPLSSSLIFRGISNAGSSPGPEVIYNNIISNITSNGASEITGISSSIGQSEARTIRGNIISQLRSEGGSVNGIVTGFSLISTIEKNKISDLSTTSSSANGIYLFSQSAPTTANVSNNFISGLNSTISRDTAVSGITILSNTSVSMNANLYYNTIFLNASSTSAMFGSAGIYIKNTETNLTLRNNIIVNVSGPGSTSGLTAAYRRNGPVLTNYSTTSNNNIFYAGIPSSRNVIFYDGTNSDSTLSQYKARVAPRDSSSFTELPPFVNTTTVPYDLHLKTNVMTLCESGGKPVSVTDDIDGNIRDTVKPDIGADEGNFLPFITPPAAPILIFPVSDSVNVSLTPVLDWADSHTASSYRLEISTDSGFTTIVKDTVNNISKCQVQPGILSYSTKYFWRVSASNHAGNSAFSGVFNFTTMDIPAARVNFTIIPAGSYNNSTEKLNTRDTIKVFLIDSSNCGIVDSAIGVLDSVSFSAVLNFANVNTGKYYMFAYHRNHIVTSTRLTQSIERGSSVSYDFTTDSLKAFGSNLTKLTSGLWSMIPGDANKDGFVDGLDQTIWITQNGLNGLFPGDFNSDGFVDGLDQTIWVLHNGAGYVLPCNILKSKTGTIKITKGSK